LARWIELVGGLIELGFAAFIFYILKTHSAFQEPTEAYYMLGDEFYPQGLVSYVDSKIAITSLKAFLYFLALFNEVLGIFTLYHCFKNWNRHITSALMAKLIRKFMLESKSEQQISRPIE
jgi:hypothetical protein